MTTRERQIEQSTHSEARLRSALIQQRAWIRHWQADMACNLKPTPESLQSAATSIDAALGNGASA